MVCNDLLSIDSISEFSHLHLSVRLQPTSTLELFSQPPNPALRALNNCPSPSGHLTSRITVLNTFLIIILDIPESELSVFLVVRKYLDFEQGDPISVRPISASRVSFSHSTYPPVENQRSDMSATFCKKLKQL